MLWSLVKIVFFITLIAVLALTAGALMEASGGPSSHVFGV